MNSLLNAATRSFQRWFALALKNPRTTAVGLAGLVAGAKMISAGDIEHGVTGLLVGLAALLAPDAVTVSRQGDKITNQGTQIDRQSDRIDDKQDAPK